MNTNQNSMIIEIQPDAIQLTTVKNGVRSTKMTNLRAVQEVLTKETALETPFLPGMWGMKKYIRKNERELSVFTTPPHVRTVRYNYHDEGVRKTDEFLVAMPGFCWFIHTIVRPGSEKRQYNHGMVKALNNPLYTPNQPMFQFPFSNVDDNWMCWGDMRGHLELADLSALTSLPDRFLEMEFNNHLDYGNYKEFKREKNGQTIRAFKTPHLFEHLSDLQKAAMEQGKDSLFPTDILKKQNTFQEELQHQITHRMNR